MATAKYQDQAPEETGELRWIALDEIAPAADNPRTTLTDLDDLAASIREVGVLTPVVVEQDGDRYALVAGARRHAAAKLAGCTVIPALVRGFDPVTRKTAQLSENTHRVGLTPTEEAAGYQELLALGVEPDALARHVARPRAEIDGRLAVMALPQPVHTLLADGTLTYADALLLTPLSEHPDDVAAAVDLSTKRGWDIAGAVRKVQQDRTRADREAQSRAALAKKNVPVVDMPNEHGVRGNAPRLLGGGYGRVHIKDSVHRKQPCHAAAIGHDGSAVSVCTDPRRHADDAGSGVERAPDLRAQRAQTRAANKALRAARDARALTAKAWLPDATDVRDAEVLRFVLMNVVRSASHEVLRPALALLGIEPADGWNTERPALLAHAASDLGSTLTAALAVQCAGAERDIAAKYDRYNTGGTVTAYLDLLVRAGYEELPGDQAVRDRFGDRAHPLHDDAEATAADATEEDADD